MSHYTIHQDDDDSKPVHEYRWSLLKDGKPVGEIFTQADAETIRAALNVKPSEPPAADGCSHSVALKSGRHVTCGACGKRMTFAKWLKRNGHTGQPTAEQER